ncbi:MAG: FkbM family methyltransferase [Myxococcota bacterium]|nr:FkbM family methyltransferase [Myxococcota bacterium]
MSFPDANLLVDAYENPQTRGHYESLVVEALLDPVRRAELNEFYNRLNLVAKALFQVLYWDLFRKRSVEIEPCTWTVDACGVRLDFPLRPEMLWLDWGLSVSFLGHDLGLKDFYHRVVESRFRPRCFLDVGGNYGTHSLFFLSQGVPTITFEPNPSCVEHFQSLLEFNRMHGDVVAAAVGAEPSEATLSFSERETWLGSISIGEEAIVSGGSDVKTVKVPVVTLDAVVEERGLQPGLVKLDTEGFELQVIRGARKTLETHRPIVVFESNTPLERRSIQQELAGLGFGVYPLDASLFESPRFLSEDELLRDNQANFAALHTEHGLVK